MSKMERLTCDYPGCTAHVTYKIDATPEGGITLVDESQRPYIESWAVGFLGTRRTTEDLKVVYPDHKGKLTNG